MNKCVYPSCKKKVYGTALDASLPLCEEHFDLTQWISYVFLIKQEEADNSKGKAVDK